MRPSRRGVMGALAGAAGLSLTGSLSALSRPADWQDYESKQWSSQFLDLDPIEELWSAPKRNDLTCFASILPCLTGKSICPIKTVERSRL